MMCKSTAKILFSLLFSAFNAFIKIIKSRWSRRQTRALMPHTASQNIPARHSLILVPSVQVTATAHTK
jgi:hypothetical protein